MRELRWLLLVVCFTGFSQIPISKSSLYFNHQVVGERLFIKEVFFSYEHNSEGTSLYFKDSSSSIIGKYDMLEAKRLYDGGIKVTCLSKHFDQPYLILISPKANYIFIQNLITLECKQFLYKKIPQSSYMQRF